MKTAGHAMIHFAKVVMYMVTVHSALPMQYSTRMDYANVPCFMILKGILAPASRAVPLV